MLDSTSIPRRRGVADKYSFESLRSEGLKLVQELSGANWTDYNVHDPGVTILEQLCYALTDLIYQTEVEISGQLTGSDGQIDFDQQALFRPESIYPSGPLTINDYRKLIFDSVPDLDNVWITRIEDVQQQGLYRVYAQVMQSVEEHEGEAANDRVIERINEIYAANRNLCEDLEDVRIVEHSHYSLHGTIEIGGGREPDDILAELYFKASQLIASSIPFYSYEQMLNRGKNLEDVFTGPLTPHVYVEEEQLDNERESVTDSEMIEVINGIEGVRRVDRLWFQDESNEVVYSVPRDPFSGTVPRLRFPSSDDEVGFRLRRRDREYQIPSREITWGFHRRNAEYLSRRRNRQDFAELYTVPKGSFRDISTYYSIQNQFPNVYGINRFGLPFSAAPKRKAQAANLKAYLLFFEQVIGNFQELLQQVPTLFSMDQELRQSYFHHALSNENVPDVDGLYVDEPPLAAAKTARILESYDRFGDRRNRVLDYLLGLYGEQFIPDPFLHLDYYSEVGPALEAIRIKLNLLKAIGNLI